MDELSILAVLLVISLCAAGIAARILINSSRKARKSKLDEPTHFVELGERKVAAPKGWEKMPERDSRGRFLPKKVR